MAPIRPVARRRIFGTRGRLENGCLCGVFAWAADSGTPWCTTAIFAIIMIAVSHYCISTRGQFDLKSCRKPAMRPPSPSHHRIGRSIGLLGTCKRNAACHAVNGMGGLLVTSSSPSPHLPISLILNFSLILNLTHSDHAAGAIAKFLRLAMRTHRSLSPSLAIRRAAALCHSPSHSTIAICHLSHRLRAPSHRTYRRLLAVGYYPTLKRGARLAARPATTSALPA